MTKITNTGSYQQEDVMTHINNNSTAQLFGETNNQPCVLLIHTTRQQVTAICGDI
jgi:hypothetical protein